MPARYFYRAESRKTRTRNREQYDRLWDAGNILPPEKARTGVPSAAEQGSRAAQLEVARRRDGKWRRDRTRTMQQWIDTTWNWENSGHRRFRLGALGMLAGVGGSSMALLLPLFATGNWTEYLAVAGHLLLFAGLALFAFGWITETTAASARRWLLASARRSDAPVRDPSRGE